MRSQSSSKLSRNGDRCWERVYKRFLLATSHVGYEDLHTCDFFVLAILLSTGLGEGVLRCLGGAYFNTTHCEDTTTISPGCCWRGEVVSVWNVDDVTCGFLKLIEPANMALCRWDTCHLDWFGSLEAEFDAFGVCVVVIVWVMSTRGSGGQRCIATVAGEDHRDRPKHI